MRISWHLAARLFMKLGTLFTTVLRRWSFMEPYVDICLEINCTAHSTTLHGMREWSDTPII